MVYKRFNVFVSWLVVLLAATLFAFSWTLTRDNLKVTSFNLGVLAVLECWYLLYYVRRTNRDIARFFNSFRNKDSGANFEGKYLGGSFGELYQSMNSVLEEYSNLQQEREAQYNFFVNAFQQVPVGILVYNNAGEVRLQNKALVQLLKVTSFKNMKSIDKFRPGFASFIDGIKPGQSEIITEPAGNNIVRLSIKASEFIVRNESLRLIIFQDITSELEHAEIESMQKMVRVLTHEIMNSVSPITLASASLIRQCETSGDGGEDRPDVLRENLAGLKAIHKRSKGLTNFVENYRQLTRLPQPVFETVEVRHFFSNLEALLSDQISQKGISWTCEVVPENMTMLADEKLLEQVMINLVKNSIEALDDCANGYIKVAAVKLGEQIIIQVEDNGKGIPAEISDQIFTPMFSTKPQGTGIGLSLSRQIIHMHRGSIQVNSEPGLKTVMTIRI
ncbi:MAG TPA: ATP-binding protein [Bacteroidales bacterium]|nr:ATP-binding protein [Bacteroidales bacterium]